MKLKVSINKLYYLFVVSAFLFPRGFSEISQLYHEVAALIVWIAVALIFVKECLSKVMNIKFNLCECLIALYFVLAFIITFLSRGIISSGLQQIFAVPVLCIFIISNMRKQPKILLEVFIFVFTINFILNAIFTIIKFKFGEHLTFLGHVQVISQLGVTAIFISVLYWLLFRANKRKVKILIIITLLTMFTTDADSAVLSAVALCISYITYKWKLYHLFDFRTEFYLAGMLILNLLIVYMTSINRNIIPNLDFSGRRFVWESALLNITKSFWFGYGIDGVLLKTFWTKVGFNYAHNQILQNMIDGGIVLTIAFWVMIVAFISRIRFIEKKQYRVLANAALLTLFFIMIFDSTTLYCYMYIILAIVYVVPSLERIQGTSNTKTGELKNYGNIK